ncbi:Transposase, partial [Cordylochernes scorpioides]
MVIGLKRAGWSIRQIAADTHLGASTVHRLWRRWLEQGNVAIYRNAGATRVTSARVDRRILRQAVAAPQATCTAILQHVQDTLDHSISTRTISRRLVANGLHSCRPLRRLPLTPPNRRQRLEWCRARSTWMTEWHRVVFSDELRFCLSSDSRRVRVWRRRGERSNPAAIVERPTVRQRGIMVWGAIAYDSRSPLLRIQGTMTAQRYVDDVLRPVTLPYLQGVPNALYQQDNARPHTARISQQALQDVQMLPWPPYSPDLSPIEHVWDIIGRRLHALPQPRSEDELWQMVEREWRAIPQDVIRTLIDSLPRRVAACFAVRVVNIHAAHVYMWRILPILCLLCGSCDSEGAVNWKLGLEWGEFAVVMAGVRTQDRATGRLSEWLSQHRIRRHLPYNQRTSVRNDCQQTTEIAEFKSSSTVTMPIPHTDISNYSGVGSDQLGTVLTGVFSDVLRVLLCLDDRRKRVWRRPGQRVDPSLTFEHHTGPQQALWSGVPFHIKQDPIGSHSWHPDSTTSLVHLLLGLPLWQYVAYSTQSLVHLLLDLPLWQHVAYSTPVLGPPSSWSSSMAVCSLLHSSPWSAFFLVFLYGKEDQEEGGPRTGVSKLHAAIEEDQEEGGPRTGV